MSSPAISNVTKEASGLLRGEVSLSPGAYAALEDGLRTGTFQFNPATQENERAMLYLALCLLGLSNCRNREDRESLLPLLARSIRIVGKP